MTDGSGRAAHMLAATPEIADPSFATAVILGDAARVSRELLRDPRLATGRETCSGWAPLHAVSAPRLHQFAPERAEGLVDVAQSLLASGADPLAVAGWSGARWTPLGCAIGSSNSGPSNRGIIELLLDWRATIEKWPVSGLTATTMCHGMATRAEPGIYVWPSV